MKKMGHTIDKPSNMIDQINYVMLFFSFPLFKSFHMTIMISHLDPPANGQAVIYLTGLLEVFISESSILATVSDNSVRYQAINYDPLIFDGLVLLKEIRFSIRRGSCRIVTEC